MRRLSLASQPWRIWVLLLFVSTHFRRCAGETRTDDPLIAAPAITAPEQLNAWRREAEYYKKQTEQIGKTDWPDLIGKIATPLVALLAAGIAFRNLQKSTEDNTDDQLYEALKRLGDPTSPTLRATAAGMILPACGSTKTTKFHDRYQISQEQLMTAILLETHPTVLGALQDAFRSLFRISPVSCYNLLYQRNLELQRRLVVTMARFVSFAGVTGVENISQELWETVESITNYSRAVLETLIRRNQRDAPTGTFHLGPRFEIVSTEVLFSYDQETLRKELAEASRHLHLNVDMWADASSHFAVPRADSEGERVSRFHGLFLAEAVISNANFNGVDLQSAQIQNAKLDRTQFDSCSLFNADLSGATLSDCSLWDADCHSCDFRHTVFHHVTMYNAKMIDSQWDTSHVLTHTNWWAADFFNSIRKDPDRLSSFFARLSSLVPRFPLKWDLGPPDSVLPVAEGALDAIFAPFHTFLEELEDLVEYYSEAPQNSRRECRSRALSF